MLTNPTTPSNAPYFWLQDAASNAGQWPIFEVSGGSGSSTLGIEVTGTASGVGSGTNPAPYPSWSALQPAGYGGLTLFQTTGATSTQGVASPILSLCGAQYGTGGGGMTGPQGSGCWSWQVSANGGSNAPDVLSLTRLNAVNTTSNITVLFPAAINLATAPLVGLSGTTAGQITVGPQPVSASVPNANVPSTFTGASTANATSSAQAGPVTVQPGQLTAGTPASGATEGALQILQSYLGTNNAGANTGLLACPSGTAQGVVPCTTQGQAENWVGVYNAIVGQQGPTVTPLRYGRVPVKSSANATWVNGDFVCKDDTTGNASLSMDNGSTPCPAGESIGIAVGDPTSPVTSLHVVDLIQSPSTGGGAMLTFFCTSQTASGTVFLFPSAVSTACGATGGSAADVMVPVSVTGWLKNLQVYYNTAPSGTDTVTVWKCPMTGACTATPINCPVVGTSATPKVCSDPTNTVQVSRGEFIEIRDATTGTTGANVRVSIEIQ